MIPPLEQGIKRQTRRLRVKNINVGDTLAVKQTHYVFGQWIGTKKKKKFVPIESKDKPVVLFKKPYHLIEGRPINEPGYYKRSAMFMFTKYAVNFIKVTAIRKQKLDDVTDEECISEGIEQAKDHLYPLCLCYGNGKVYSNGNFSLTRSTWVEPKLSFFSLLNMVNKKTINPETVVTVIEFEKI